MNRFTDPATGRPYEVGPDGAARWVPDADPHTDARPWYRKVRYAVPLAAVAGLLVAGAANSSNPAGAGEGAGATPTVTVTSTVTAEPVVPTAEAAATPTAEPAPVTVTATRTVTSKPRTVKVTVTRTATTQALAAGGSGGGGGSTYYANCSAARAAGAAPLFRGDPGYRAGLDRDGDGIACE